MKSERLERDQLPSSLGERLAFPVRLLRTRRRASVVRKADFQTTLCCEPDPRGPVCALQLEQHCLRYSPGLLGGDTEAPRDQGTCPRSSVSGCRALPPVSFPTVPRPLECRAQVQVQQGWLSFLSLPQLGWLVSVLGTSSRNYLTLTGELQLFSLRLSLALNSAPAPLHLRHAHFSSLVPELASEDVKCDRGVVGLESPKQRDLPWETWLVQD